MKYWGLLSVLAVVVSAHVTESSTDRPGNMLAEAQNPQLLINTMFSEHSPGFNDLYMIQTPDKGREIIIYCNPSYCYKLKGHTVTG